MVDIKTEQMNGQPSTSPVRGFFGQAAEVTGDVIELAELQVRLAKADAENAVRIAVFPIAVIGTSGVVLLASLPVLLFSIAGLVARTSGMSVEFAQMLVSAIATVLAISAAAIAGRYLKSAVQAFGRSAEELKHNLMWLKTIFRSSKT